MKRNRIWRAVKSSRITSHTMYERHYTLECGHTAVRNVTCDPRKTAKKIACFWCESADPENHIGGNFTVAA